ncbi:copper amine oxidase N-terminal domain-containing protein [Desulfothermobacter acidiphilus]|uniref:copper amine oxidase N-terminal domain-containing protein n=1 Tax=Desulfothermobacter acidiphilus TaxID=1938353 RepID=UPI003F89CD12
MLRRLIIALVSLSALLAVFPLNSALAADGGKQASYVAQFVVGQSVYWTPISMEATTFIHDGRAFVPARYLALALGVPQSGIKWDEATRTVTLVREEGNRCLTVKLRVGSKTLEVANAPGAGTTFQSVIVQHIQMDVAPELRDGRVYLPARYVAEAFGYQVQWVPAIGAVVIVH